MKNLTIIIIFLILSLNLYSQISEEEPLNPEYIEYLLLKSEGKWQETTKEGYKLGYIPPAHKPLTGLVKKKKGDKLLWDPPASYDLRTLSLLTSVKKPRKLWFLLVFYNKFSNRIQLAETRFK
jgi:hypothetical protein